MGRDVVQVFEVVIQVIVQVGRASARSIANAGQGEREGRARQRDGRAAPDIGPDDSLVWGAKMAPIIKVGDGQITGLGWPPLDEYILNNQPNGHDDDNDNGGGGGGRGGAIAVGRTTTAAMTTTRATTMRATMTTAMTMTTYPDVPSHRGLERKIINAGRARGGGGDETMTSLRRRGRGR